MDSKNLERGTQLLELGRYKDAIPYLQDALAEHANDWLSKYNLAVCFFNLENYTKASQLLDNLMYQTPDNSDLLALKSQIAIQQDRFLEAKQFIEEAISLDPYDSDFFGIKAGILLEDKQYENALEFVNKGLSINPKNTYCLNLRAQVLTKLNRTEEANNTVDNILSDNPEDAYSHSNVGWVQLENGNNQKALEHFKEALQLDPNFEYARQGMSTAIKTKNVLYNWYIKYSFWIEKKSTKNQWIFIIGLYFIYRIGVKMLSASGFSYLVIPLMIVYLLFVLGGWIMEPLSNAILNFDNYGKYLLAKTERLSGYIFSVLLLVGLTAIILFYITDIQYLFATAITFFCCLLPLSRAFLLESKKGKTLAITYGGIMLVVGLIGPLFATSVTVSIIVFVMMLIYTWIGNFLESK